jgi:hypothetical protein
MKKEFTGFYDENRSKIYLYDKLRSEWNYDVIVHKDENGDYYGKLVCDKNHSCKDIPYALNSGKGHIKIK